jgi:thiamine biosynthesis lipoprotein
LAAGVVAAASSATAESRPPVALVTLRGPTMGTAYSVKCWAPGGATAGRDAADAPDDASLRDAVERVLAEIDVQMSNYRPDSELSQFNRAAAGAWFPVSPATALVVSEALRYHRLTQGAFDVTVGPALALWRFGPQGGDDQTAYRAPSDDQLAAALTRMGADRLAARLDPPALRKEVDGLEVDLSAIAKGYGVDAVGERLRELGMTNFMVEIGGEIRAAGVRPDGQPWRIGIEHPQVDRPSLSRVAPLRDLAMATSGDYRNFRRHDGRRFSHVLDPRTARPIPYRGVSVTVVAATCMEADALATALLVMPPAEAYAWCEREQVAALFHFREPPAASGPTAAASASGDDVVVRSTARFRTLVPEISPPPTVGPASAPR